MTTLTPGILKAAARLQLNMVLEETNQWFADAPDTQDWLRRLASEIEGLWQYDADVDYRALWAAYYELEAKRDAMFAFCG